MRNKTCGECRYLGSAKETGLCKKRQICLYPEELPACSNFAQKVITNGDRIRRMSNEELATAWSEEAFLFAWCYDCMEYCKDGSTPENKLKCKNKMLNWLNAPAGCVAENGESAKQANLCCKSAKESEGEDE